MQLDKLLKNIRYPESLYAWPSAKRNLDEIAVNGVSIDSREVKPGYLFIAVPGSKVDGAEFITQAINNGADIIATSSTCIEKYAADHPNICFLEVSNLRKFSAYAARTYYPEQPKVNAAVTGTNGKTSVAEFTRQLWEIIGKPCASLGTLGIKSKMINKEKRLTTPDPIYLHKMLSEMESKGIDNFIMEASSHGIDQHRLDGVKLNIAAFTNISPEHLDYHKTMEKYFEAKLKLFTQILPFKGTCILNADTPEFKKMKIACAPRKVISYGKKGYDIILKEITPCNKGQKLTLGVFGKDYTVNFPLYGEFQVYNALCALGIVIASDSRIQDRAVAALETLEGIPGRLEFVGKTANNASVFIDYAHTENAMENLLHSLRQHTKGKLHILFGGGGDRDQKTRKPRGEICKKLADKVYITDDNPRNEDPEKIRKQILEGCPDAEVIPDRDKGIKKAVENLKTGDILVVAGKGPEEGQIVKDKTLPFSDKQSILDAIKGL
jgi:UDP-N-acetylmuramoyl-L-alanyl-D-glutamate--2,6-diaminopimelate ligase